MRRQPINQTSNSATKNVSPAFEQPIHVGRPNVGDTEIYIQRVRSILDNRWLTNNGPFVQEFEQRIAAYLGVKHCIAMCNGTIALEIAIRALGLQGEVIVPSWTFIATAHALYWQGITPVFADIDPATHNLSPTCVRRMITPRTTGIIGVHLWGRPAPIQELQTIADEHDLKLLFDAAHAFGCSHKGTTIGAFGSCEVLSFHATKVFNTFEGGAVVTNDDALAETMRLMRNFGFNGYDNVVHPGTNGKMSEINAAMGLTNLEALPNFIEANRRSYEAYAEALNDVPGVGLVHYQDEDTPNYHYVVMELSQECASKRDEIFAALHAENVLARKYFWPGCHRMQPYSGLFPQAGLMLPETVSLSDRIIILPTGPSLSTEDIAQIVSIIRYVVTN